MLFIVQDTRSVGDVVDYVDLLLALVCSRENANLGMAAHWLPSNFDQAVIQSSQQRPRYSLFRRGRYNE